MGKVAPIVLALLLALGSALAQTSHDRHAMHEQQPSTAFGRQMAAAMMKMHEDMSAPPQTGDADRDFLAMMIPHHQGAVDMARLVLIYGHDPLVRQLATEIIAGQQAEIDAMKARLEVLKAGPNPNPDNFPAIEGTRGGN
jgi:uncharacterized protein (DUF305 family)